MSNREMKLGHGRSRTQLLAPALEPLALSSGAESARGCADVWREAAAQLCTVLDEIEAGELACSTAERRRIEGAALALESLANDRFLDASALSAE